MINLPGWLILYFQVNLISKKNQGNKVIKHNPIAYLKDLGQNKAAAIFNASALSKALSFLTTVIVVWIIPKEQFGWVSYAMTIIVFLSAFAGGGLEQSLLRFGSLSDSQFQKKSLFQYSVKRGLILTTIIALLIIILSKIITTKIPESFPFLIACTLILYGYFIQSSLLSYYRVIRLNRLYARAQILFSCVLFLFAVCLSYTLGVWGYVIALIISPMVSFAILAVKTRVFTSVPPAILGTTRLQFFEYGFFVSIGSMLSQMIFTIDIFLIGYVLEDSELVAQYRVTNIIPYAFIIFPMAIAATEFVKITRQSQQNKPEMLSYYRKYLNLIAPLAFAMLVFIYLFGEYLLLLFGKDYQGYGNLMLVFSIGIAGSFVLRTPLGNFISAIGWPKINVIISVIALILNIVFTYILVSQLGIIGAAISSSIILWLIGFAYLFVVIYWYRSDS